MTSGDGSGDAPFGPMAVRCGASADPHEPQRSVPLGLNDEQLRQKVPSRMGSYLTC